MKSMLPLTFAFVHEDVLIWQRAPEMAAEAFVSPNCSTSMPPDAELPDAHGTHSVERDAGADAAAASIAGVSPGNNEELFKKCVV